MMDRINFIPSLSFKTSANAEIGGDDSMPQVLDPEDGTTPFNPTILGPRKPMESGGKKFIVPDDGSTDTKPNPISDIDVDPKIMRRIEKELGKLMKLDMQKSSLETKVTDLKSQLAKVDADIAKKAEIKARLAEIEELLKTTTDETEKAKLEAEKTDLEAQLAVLNHEKEKTELNKEKLNFAAQLDEMKAENAAKLADIEAKKAEIKEKLAQETDEEAKAELETQLKELEEQLETEKAQAKEKEAELQAKIDELENRLLLLTDEGKRADILKQIQEAESELAHIEVQKDLIEMLIPLEIFGESPRLNYNA